MNLEDRFKALVEPLLPPNGVDFPTGLGGLVFQFEGRSHHLGLRRNREEIIVSTPVFFSLSGGLDLYPDVISEFNAYYLFHGGYRLGIDFTRHAIYASQVKAVSVIEKSGLAACLREFRERCASCTSWYASVLSERPAPPVDLTLFDYDDNELDELKGILEAAL